MIYFYTWMHIILIGFEIHCSVAQGEWLPTIYQFTWLNPGASLLSCTTCPYLNELSELNLFCQ